MDSPIVQLPLDLTGTNPNNHIGSEEHLLVDLDGFPYKIITLFHGGFYTKGLKVYDADYNKLMPDVDYICTYKHQQVSDRTGLEVCSAIVFINPAIDGIVYTSSQMVGGDLAFSFTVVQDYITFYNTKTSGYVPKWVDYNGTEPNWGPGELVQQRWGLDTYQPFNNELEVISRRMMIGADAAEENLRDSIRDRLDVFLARFNSRLQDHIDDKANPHHSDAEKVGLGLLRNLPVATTPQAIAITSDALYMTPALSWQVSDQLAALPLKAHTDLKPANPHDVKSAQLNSHDKAQATAIINSKHNKGTTISNTRTIMYQGEWHTYEAYVAKLRKNLSTTYFPNGVLQPSRLGAGPLEWNAVMRGDRRWSRVSDILAEYVTAPAASFNGISVNTYDPNVAMNIVRSTWPYEPVGSTVFARCLVQVSQGWGNGSQQYDVAQDYAFVMTPSGWIKA
jgi:hypothetical protein